MNDIEDLLRSDADEWGRSQPAPPDFDSALRAVTTRARFADAIRRRRLAGAVGAVLAVAATVIAAAIVGAHRHNGSSGAAPTGAPKAPKSIVVHGKTVPYAGQVPWADAVIADARSSSVVIYADGDSMVAKKFVCGLPDERIFATETSTSVTILVAGYGTPLPAGEACSAVGHRPQIERVTLTAPLGRRKLVDATGLRMHTVLDASSVPAPTVPSGFTADPVQWDDKTGVATRGYAAAKDAERIYLDYGTASAITGDDGHGGSVLQNVRIGSATATVRRYRDMYNDETTVIWSVGPHRLALIVYGSPKVRLTVAAAIGIARSVR